jgi:hypothetical protein
MDLRERVIEAVAAGGISTRGGETLRDQPERRGDLGAALESYGNTGTIVAKSSGGSVSPLENHTAFLLGLVKEQPDLTLEEIVAAMARAKIAGSRTAGVAFLRTARFQL